MSKKVETVDDAELAFSKLVNWDAIEKIESDGELVESSNRFTVSNKYTVMSYGKKPDERMITSTVSVSARNEDGTEPVIGVQPIGSGHPRMYPILSISPGAGGVVSVGIPDGDTLMFREMKLEDAEWIAGKDVEDMKELISVIEEAEIY